MRVFSPPPQPLDEQNHRSLGWQRTATLTIRGASPSEKTLISSSLTSHWNLYGDDLIAPEEKSLIFYDEELIGSLGMSRDPRGGSLPGFCPGCAAELTSFAGGPLAFGAGLAIDTRLQRQLSQAAFLDILRRCGPNWSELYARRFGLSGYLAVIAVPGFKSYGSRMSPEAYLQQVRARSIVEPLLTVYLEAQAQILEVVDQSTGPAVLLGWTNPR